MRYYTVEDHFSSELEEKQSRFIAHLVPIADFQEKLTDLKALHPKASHHVTAFRQISEIDQISEGAKDDGEPAGTSGMPVLKTLMGADLINVAMIVTRYFGGTKLGMGGLARAYSGASILAIQQARKVEWKRIVHISQQVDFANSSEVERQIMLTSLTVLERKYNEDGVTFALEGAEDDIVRFKANLGD